MNLEDSGWSPMTTCRLEYVGISLTPLNFYFLKDGPFEFLFTKVPHD